MFIVFSLINYFFTNNLPLSLFTSYLISDFLPIGKTYIYQILSLDFLPHLKNQYPLGLIEIVKFTINDIFFLFIFFYLIRQVLIKIDFKLDKTIKIFILFLLWGLISDYFSSPNFLLSIFIKKDLYKLIFIYFFIKQNKKEIKIDFFLNILVIILIFESFLALLQLINHAPIGKNIEATHSIEFFGNTVDELTFYFRPIGTFIHANYLGGFLTLNIPLIIYLVFLKKQFSFFNIGTLIISFSVLMFTLSRSAFLSLLIFLIFVYFAYKKNFSKFFIKNKSFFLKNSKIIILIITISILIFILPIIRIFKIIDSFSYSGGIYLRFNQIIETLKVIALNPIFGTGTGFSVTKSLNINKFGIFSSFPSVVHNYYLLIATENGLPYLFLFIIFLKKLIQNFFYINRYFGFLLIVLIIYSLFQPFFFLSEFVYLYAIMKKNEK